MKDINVNGVALMTSKCLVAIKVYIDAKGTIDLYSEVNKSHKQLIKDMIMWFEEVEKASEEADIPYFVLVQIENQLVGDFVVNLSEKEELNVRTIYSVFQVLREGNSIHVLKEAVDKWED